MTHTFESPADLELAHYGVKGMRWGIRKDRERGDSFRSRYKDLRTTPLETITVTAKNGKKVVAKEIRPLAVAAAFAARSPEAAERFKQGVFLNFYVDGKRVGEGNLYPKSKDEMYLNWIGISPKHRGKGYASALFDAGIEYSKKQGAKKLTLEVPGDAPDARHIYEKKGFKVSGSVIGHPNDAWGGLTPMTLDIDKKSFSHIDQEDLNFEMAIEQHFNALYLNLKPYETFNANGGRSMTHEIEDFFNQSTLNVQLSELELTHYGVKGMRWGVRKDRSGRYSEQQNFMSDEAAKATSSRLKTGSREKPRATDTLTNEELSQAITRMRLEREFNSLAYETRPIGKGRAFLHKLGVDITKAETSRVAKGAVSLGVEQAIATKSPKLANRIKPKKK